MIRKINDKVKCDINGIEFPATILEVKRPKELWRNLLYIVKIDQPTEEIKKALEPHGLKENKICVAYFEIV